MSNWMRLRSGEAFASAMAARSVHGYDGASALAQAPSPGVLSLLSTPTCVESTTKVRGTARAGAGGPATIPRLTATIRPKPIFHHGLIAPTSFPHPGGLGRTRETRAPAGRLVETY